jgi:hypothetical protein
LLALPEQFYCFGFLLFHPDQVPFLPLARVEQFLNRGLKTYLRGRWGYQLGVVTTTVGRLTADLG